ncbi:MAG: hypothetical protein INR64_15730 [Caulobacteraceae bacterium]|nr:hypothetical protein [Caulobacter sp.]
MKTTLTLVAAAASLLAATAASAQVNARQDEQQRRIDNGVASGRLTPGEAAHDERQQGRIARTEDRMRARNGGPLTANQKARLNARQNAASAHIRETKHNGRVD